MTPRRAGPSLVDLVALAIPVVLLLALIAVIDRDPAAGVTASRSPFSDEAWSVMNARNLVRLGTWAPDDWRLYLVNLPFSVIEAGVFRVLGVGIVQARLVSVVATVATAAILAIGLRRPFGRIPAVLAAAAFAASTLVLFYGDLAIMEPLVTAALTGAAVLTVRLERGAGVRIGILTGMLLALAIGTKPNAALAAVGIVGGVVLARGISAPATRGWAVATIATVAGCAIAWLVAFGLPNLDAVLADVRIWPAQGVPKSPVDLVVSILRYPFTSDGAVPAIGFLWIGGIAGGIVSVIRWRMLDPAARGLIGASIGWLGAAAIPLLVLSYHPNRYAEPLIPALAILVGAGTSALTSWPTAASSPRTRVIAVVVAAALLVGPGVIGYLQRGLGSTRTLVDEQAAFARDLPPGAVVEGDFAPLLAMTTGARTIVAWPHAGVNNGDEYAAGVRWLLIPPETPPDWVSLHRDAWAGRQRVRCLTWGSEPVCLYALP